MVGTLPESQLFGHMRGAFTATTDTRLGFRVRQRRHRVPGRSRRNIPPMQVKLLRVIQNREIRRVCSPEVKLINEHWIAATNRDRRAEVLAGRFRENSFYRLSSIQIRIPSLRERLEDIPLLVQFFLKKYNEAYGKKIPGLTRGAKAVPLQHPGRATCADWKMSSPARASPPP
jgi:transcriptional regulator with GAF, ATPase, and Fis domain